MASINLDKVRDLYGNSTDLQGQFIDYLRNVESELDFSKFEGLDNQAIFTNLMESGQKEIKVNPNNPAKPLNYRPRREQTYKQLKVLDDELKNQPFYKDLAMRATQVLDQINPTPFRQKELETRRHKAQEILNHLKRSGVTSEQFAKEYGDSPFLREAYFENQDIFSNIFDLSHDTSAALFGGKNAQAKAYDFELESYNTYKTIAQRKLDDPNNYYKLTPKEREIIDQRLGAFSAWWHNDSNKEKVDLYLDLENAKESASNFVAAQKRLENVNSNEQFLGLIGALKHGKEFDKKQKAMIEDYAIVAKELGFDTLAYNKTGLYFIKDEKAYKVEQGLWDEIKGVFKDNIGSLAGAIAGAEYGYKKGKVKGMVAYGAAGAFGGGVTDSMIADVLANKKIDLAQALLHGAQEGALNIAADAVLKVAGTAIKTLNPEKLKNIAGTAIDYTPVLGFAKRAKDGNKAAAQKLIDHAIPQEAQADLKALESIFGAEVQIGATKTSQAQNAINALQNKLGSDSYIVRGAQSLYNTFAFTSQKQAQKDFIRAIRADESGNLTAFLSEAANASPVIQKNLLNILDQTSQKLAHQLERFELPPSTIKDVFDNFEKGTKQSYTDAIEQILLKVYDESYTTTLAKDSPNIPSNLSEQEAARFNTDSLESFKAKMEKSGILLEDSAKFLRFVESTIYNPKGVTFETLNNAQKTLNTYYKQASDPNFRSFVKNAVNGFIKRDIQAGIEAIFAQNKTLYNDARTLFDTALSDYAKMKETLKLADSLKIRDRRRSYEQVAQTLSRFFLGQGENIPNFEALLGSLQKELREQVELKLLQDMLELSFVKLNDIKVLDSSEFFKRLEPLKGHFHSTSAKDFIKIAQDFHTLFRNDANIAKSLSPATTEKIGTSIATTLEGAVRFQVIKALFANIIRLMPHIPFAKRLNESVQGSALRYQLKKALDSSLSVGEFKLELQARAIKADFTNATREQIAKILGQVESAQESLERAPAQPPLRADEIGEAKQGEAADSLAIHKTDIQETQAPKDTEKGYIVRDFEIPQTPAETQAQKVDSTLESQATKEPSPSPLEQAHAQKQAKKAEQEAAKQAQAQADQNTAQAIKDRNDQIQNLKDSRAGKSEMEREVKLGQPIAMKRTEQPPTSIATDDNNIYQLDFVIVKAHDVKPNFNADGLQPRTQKEHITIESIAQNFKPEMVLGRGGYKDLPIIAKDGQVITGNHRVQGFKNFTRESRAAYEKAIKDRFNIELASDELLLRTPSDDLSVKELLSIAYNSNKEDIKNLGDHIYSVLGRYAPNFDKLPRQLESSSVQELKSKIARILDPSPYPNENDANLALLANTIKADKNANITEMLNAFSKLDKEDAARTLNTFTDTAGLWHILSNNAVEYGLKQLDLRPYLLGAMYKSAVSQNTTRAANFKELNTQIKYILDTTDSSGSNAMLLMLPNTYDNLIADLLGASLARFMRLENPSANLYEALKGANSGIREQLAPRLDFDIGYTAGRNIEQADIFDFIEYMIRQGEGGKEVNEAVELLPKLREKYEAFKASSTPTPPSTPPKPTLESQAGKEASAEAPAQKVETSLSQEIKDTPKKSQREQVKQQLQSIKNIDITHKSGIVARLSSTGIDKMLSDKAIQKSLDNGFTKEQHFNAVADIERLFKNSDFSHTESPKNQSADIVGIHRYINTQDLQDQNAQALITLKESVENGNRIYSVELEGLAHPSNLDRSPKSKGVENSHHDDAGATEAARLFENPSEIIPQSHTALSKQAQDHARQILQGLRKTAQTPLNKLADEVPSTDRKFMIREAKYIKQQAKEFADNFANLRWQDLRAAIRYAKVPYDEAMFKELKESIESGEFARFIESSYPPKPSQKSLFDTQELTPPKVDSSDLNTYTDTKGHTHQIPADIAQQWLKTFDLKDLQEAYTPQFSEQVAQALEPILQGESIKLYAGSLIKLIKENRLQYLDRIKPTLEQPQRVILQNDGALIFARDFGGEKYFTSVARNDDGEWIIRSNAPKSESGLDNKIAAGGREIYNSQAATQINAHSPYDDIAKSNTKLDSDTIPQKSNYALLDNNLVEVIGQKIFHNYNKPYKERMSEIREFFTLPKEHFTKILDKYKREVNSLEKGEIYNKIATTMSIDEITDEITRSLKIKRERGYAAQAEKYFNELEEKALHISKMLQDMPYQIRDFIQNSAIDYKAAQWQKLLNTLDRLITRNNEKILENVQIRHKEYVEKFKNLATRNFSLWKNINALLNKEGIREVGDTLEIRNKNTLDSIFKQTTPPNTPTPPHTPKVDSSVESTPPKDTLEYTSTPTPSQPHQAQKLKEALQIPLTDDRGLQSLAFGRVGSDAEIMEQVLIPQARNAYRKGTSQNKLEVAARNALKKHRQDLEQSLNITPIKEFGTNYAEHYHSGESAIQKLLLERNGQIAGAFYREGIGDITLAWGEKGTGKSDGWGLAKIAEYHPEVLDKLDKLIQDLTIVKETENRYKLDNGDFFISIRKDFEGQKQNWVLTALERDESIARRRTDLPSSQSEAEKTTSANATGDSTTKTFNQADIKLESLSDFSKFARLAGFGDLSEQELERAHKHILANLEKLRC